MTWTRARTLPSSSRGALLLAPWWSRRWGRSSYPRTPGSCSPTARSSTRSETRFSRSSKRYRPAVRELAAGVFYKGHYYLALGEFGTTVNTLLLDYDTVLKSWWAHSIPSHQLQVWEPSPGDVQLYSASSATDRVERLFVPNRRLDADDTVPTCFWQGPHHTFGVPFRTKRVKEVFFDGKGRLKVYLAQNFADAAVFQDEVVLGADAG